MYWSRVTNSAGSWVIPTCWMGSKGFPTWVDRNRHIFNNTLIAKQISFCCSSGQGHVAPQNINQSQFRACQIRSYFSPFVLSSCPQAEFEKQLRFPALVRDFSKCLRVLHNKEWEIQLSEGYAHIICASRADLGLPCKKQINFCLNVLGNPRANNSHPKKGKPHVAGDHLLQHIKNYKAKKSSGRCGWHGIPHYCQPLELKWMSRCNALM